MHSIVVVMNTLKSFLDAAAIHPSYTCLWLD